MTSMQRQAELLGELSQILHNEADAGYDVVFCEYVAQYGSISSRFYFEKDQNRVEKFISDDATLGNRDIALELRTLMKEHTGGEWSSFTLTLDADGKATTKFEYPE